MTGQYDKAGECIMSNTLIFSLNLAFFVFIIGVVGHTIGSIV